MPLLSLLRTLLILGRVSNLPTVWTNTLAGCALAGAAVGPGRLALLAIAFSLLYTGGMYLNDAFDRVWDVSVEKNLTLRTSALVAGIKDVGAALEARGLYP